MAVVKDIRETARLTQAELAQLAGTSQPAIAAYESAAKTPNLRTLRRIARAAGFDLELSLVPAMTREDRRSLHLHTVIARRFRQDPETTIAAARANLARMRELHPGAAELLDEWAGLLDGPFDDLVATLTSRDERTRMLRQVTPFAGILSADDRASAYRDFRRLESRRES